MPRSVFIVAAILVICLLTLLLLAWVHVIPGGWLLRNLFESPEAREARLMEEHRAERLALFSEGPREMPAGCVLFIGSSTLERFPLESSFPGVATLNRGIGGEPARLMIERLEASLPESGRERAAGAVVYAGTIDFRIERVEIGEAVIRVSKLVGKLRELTRADLPVLLLGPLPGNEADERYRGRAMEELEGAYRELAEETGLEFLPLAREPFRAEDGGLSKKLSVDRYHLGDEGYRLLAEVLRAEGGRVGSLLRGE